MNQARLEAMNAPSSLSEVVSAEGQVLGRPKGRLGLFGSRHEAILARVSGERHVLDPSGGAENPTAP